MVGLLVPPFDACALADAIQALLRDADLYQQLAQAGWALVAKKFNVSRSARRLVELFES